jgi:hypothetical protein
MKRVFGVFGLAIAMAFSVAMSPAIARDVQIQVYSATYDAASLADGVGETTTVTVPGAALGDACVASLGVSSAGITITCNVTSASTASVRVQNESTGTLDLASTTLRIFLLRKGAN